VPENETRALSLSVQDALKMVVSGGMINPGDSQRMKPDTELTRVILRETSKAALNAAPGPTSNVQNG
jgi:uncharacterized membrane protein